MELDLGRGRSPGFTIAEEGLPVLVKRRRRWWWGFSPLLLKRRSLRLEEITLEVLLEIHRALRRNGRQTITTQETLASSETLLSTKSVLSEYVFVTGRVGSTPTPPPRYRMAADIFSTTLANKNPRRDNDTLISLLNTDPLIANSFIHSKTKLHFAHEEVRRFLSAHYE